MSICSLLYYEEQQKALRKKKYQKIIAFLQQRSAKICGEQREISRCLSSFIQVFHLPTVWNGMCGVSIFGDGQKPFGQQSWPTGSRWPCLSNTVGSDGLQKSLPASAMLWLYVIIFRLHRAASVYFNSRESIDNKRRVPYIAIYVSYITTCISYISRLFTCTFTWKIYHKMQKE